MLTSECTELPTAELWSIKIQQCAGLVTQALNIRRLAELISGTQTLTRETAWLLGTRYNIIARDSDDLASQVQSDIKKDFTSKIWCTYRRRFPFIGEGEGKFSSDVGWGCTLRSGQMLVAEALSRQLLGRDWRRDQKEQHLPDMMLKVLSWLQDDQGVEAPLSIHSLCSSGRSHGVVPGRWLGPWTLCKSLEAAIAREPCLAMRVHVVCDPGGGAPTLGINSIRKDVFNAQAFTSLEAIPASLSTSTAEVNISDTPLRIHAEYQLPGLRDNSHNEEAQLQDAISTSSDRQDVDSNSPEGGQKTFSPVEDPAVLCIQPMNSEVQTIDVSSDPCYMPTSECASGPPEDVNWVNHAQQDSQVLSNHHAPSALEEQVLSNHNASSTLEERGEDSVEPLLLLIPLTLGVGKVNPLYLPQLKEVLSYPQSVGIVGGRPGASLYFVGYQGDSLMYLDPHEAQMCEPLPEAATSYFCDTLRLMPMTSMDPSLAIGFLCSTLGDFEDLCKRLRNLCSQHSSVPLLTIALESHASCLDTYKYDGDDCVYDGSESVSCDEEAAAAGGPICEACLSEGEEVELSFMPSQCTSGEDEATLEDVSEELRQRCLGLEICRKAEVKELWEIV